MRRFLPHLVVVLAAALQLGLYAAWHQDEAALEQLLQEGSGLERVHALHVLNNRGSSPQTRRAWNRSAVVPLMNDPDPLVVDFAYTVDVCRMVQPAWQEKRLSTRLQNNHMGITAKGETFAQWLRHFLLFRRKVAGRHMGAMLRLKNDELRWLLDGIANEELEAEPILAAIHQRQTRANLSRTKRMAAPDPDQKKSNAEDRRAGQLPNTNAGGKLPDGKKPGGR